jgi:hypothetical protein
VFLYTIIWGGGKMNEINVHLSEKGKSDAIEDQQGEIPLNGENTSSGYDRISQKVDELLGLDASAKRRVATYKETLFLAHKALEKISQDTRR